MKNICIIPARGGSKRIPRKNLKEFNGQPIIAYSIKAALQSGLFDTVMVSTDDEEIANLAKKFGAKVPFLRSRKNADDHATTADALAEVLGKYEKEGQKFDRLCCLYATAPFTTSEMLIESHKLLEGHSSVMPVVRYSHPPQRGLIIKNDSLEYCFPENMSKRSQDLEPIFHDVGQFYWAEVKKFNQEKKLVFKGETAAFEVPEMVAQDLDTISDWEIAEFKFRYLNKK